MHFLWDFYWQNFNFVRTRFLYINIKLFALTYFRDSATMQVIAKFNNVVFVHLSRRLKCTIVITRCPSLTFHVFDFSSKSTEQNSTKLDRKQDLNGLFQVCVFRADRKNNMVATVFHWLRHFRLLLWNRWAEFNETWQDSKIFNVLYQVFLFFGPVGKNKMAVLSNLSIKVAHCTQVHDMWPCGPLVIYGIMSFQQQYF